MVLFINSHSPSVVAALRCQHLKRPITRYIKKRDRDGCAVASEEGLTAEVERSTLVVVEIYSNDGVGVIHHDQISLLIVV